MEKGGWKSGRQSTNQVNTARTDKMIENWEETKKKYQTGLPSLAGTTVSTNLGDFYLLIFYVDSFLFFLICFISKVCSWFSSRLVLSSSRLIE